MKVGLGQINTRIADFEGNAAKVLDAYREAVSRGAEIVVFPELALCGYPPRDLIARPGFLAKDHETLQSLAVDTGSVPLVLGCLGERKSDVGLQVANRVAALHNGVVLASRDKTLLPNYDVFDEARYFEPGAPAGPVSIDGRRLGLTVCEDIWNQPGVDVYGRYAADPIQPLCGGAIDLLVNVSASPWGVGKGAIRENLVRDVARRVEAPVVYCNLVGGADELIFDGRSLVVDATGRTLARGPVFDEGVVVVETGSSAPVPVPPDEGVDDIYRALCLGVRDYVGKCGFQSVVLGLSGGIDSAVVAAIAVDALGPDRVRALAMPSVYSSEGSLRDARDLARNFGFQLDEVSIQPAFETLLQATEPLFEGRQPDATEENMQARLRGALLMSMSNKFGSLLLTTGNKSELAVGYCTLYGDMCGALAVISDVPKTIVYELARWRNRGGERIPDSIITKPPSAELRPDQTDQDSLPPYDVLDEILERYVVHRETPEMIRNAGIDADAVARVTRLIEINEYKRRQAAPGLRVTSKAFGMGRRVPIARRLRDDI